MDKKDFNYDLPEELIAQTPVYPRDSSRMLVYDRKSGSVEHKHFYDIVDYLNSGDVLVINNTKVLPVRLYGERIPTKGKIELLLSKRLDMNEWEVLVKPGKMAREGACFEFSKDLRGKVEKVLADGSRVFRFEYEGVFEDVLNRIGEMPLPHYIKQKLTDKERYNTVYSKYEGSSAAPTAGLHFTEELLEKLKSKGVEIVNVLLHVGLGTFRPVKEEHIEEHVMHSEYYELTQEAADTINAAKNEKRRVIAVGTTSVRVLESVAKTYGELIPCKGYTNIFIYPPYTFKVVDALITNFHLPESTLIMLVSALCGREQTLDLYKTAVKERYRFFSFGDCMFIE
ncbi:MAG: tRNA preQ1(34) S-adenosylmethionine ribosyltransferase-isomerase QueA [Clostridia bacterium]|nr:tRNA preQ1(34) S-adenosylmethionine ribosyltransferase-isomerase QueA [Clostridia bacterium]